MFVRLTTPKLADQFPFLCFMADDGGEGGSGDNGDAGNGDAETGAKKGDDGKAFTQADVDRIVAERLNREGVTVLREKAAKYDAAQEAAKSDIQKANDKAEAAEKRAAEAEKRAKGLSIATEFKLSAEDAALVTAQPDEPTMRALAQRLSENSRGNRVSNEGKQSQAKGDEMEEFTRRLFGRDN